jgi:hypothetical protein
MKGLGLNSATEKFCGSRSKRRSGMLSDVQFISKSEGTLHFYE